MFRSHEPAAIAPRQAPLLALAPTMLNAAIGSLALGGAERIVLDWARAMAPRHRVRLLVLREAAAAWPAPEGVEILRPGTQSLSAIGARLAEGGNPVVLCHLLRDHERRALADGGAEPVPVLHNARDGWIDSVDALLCEPRVFLVSRAAEAELADAGHRGARGVLRHLPRKPAIEAGARRAWRERWAIPQDATAIGMVGGVKPQKAYPRALRVFDALLARRDAYLVILGGPVGRDGMAAWNALIEQARRLGLEDRVRVPGFVREASRCLSAFDLLLNTSRYEGVSIAVLEAVAAGLPVVASRVGGQDEVESPGLHLLPFDAALEDWAAAIDERLGIRPDAPRWLRFPTHRLWTLAHLARRFEPGDGTLFVTANLNAGGAQRSLVNLARALSGTRAFEIAVTGESTATAFLEALESDGIPVSRTALGRDCFDHAEALIRHITARRPSAVCFWNVDAKIKLLLVKMLRHTSLALVDVSPGGHAFEEMEATSDFQQWIAFDERDYYARLDRLVLKYRSPPPGGHRPRMRVIPNGVAAPARVKPVFGTTRRIVMSGRLAPTKHLVEALEAMTVLWRRCPDAELHVIGLAEPRHADYADRVAAQAGDELGRRIFMRGAAFDAPELLADYDAALVLGTHQGCPNAVLEALAAGVPVVANDSGGTREAVRDGSTGLLLPDLDPGRIARALERVLCDARLARRLSRNGIAHAANRYSMPGMASAYAGLFDELDEERSCRSR